MLIGADVQTFTPSDASTGPVECQDSCKAILNTPTRFLLIVLAGHAACSFSFDRLLPVFTALSALRNPVVYMPYLGMQNDDTRSGQSMGFELVCSLEFSVCVTSRYSPACPWVSWKQCSG